MAYEIDFLPVGDGEKSGDAIAIRFGNLSANPPQQMVVVIDGGTKESGSNLVNHIKTHYKTSSVHAVICTHSDADHASGLTEVLENCQVGSLYMHLPWKHLNDVDNVLKNADISGSKLKSHFKKSLDNAHALESLATKKGIKIYELFSDNASANDRFCVLGPSIAFYESLLESFRCADELAPKGGFLEKAVATAQKAVKWVAETWFSETLVEPADDDCSAENNASVVLLFTDGNSKFLFTSDAGVSALVEAANCAAKIGIDLKKVGAFQVPHHGSKHNVGPAILNRIVGPTMKEQNFLKTAIVSVSKEGEPKHPSRRVVNALMRRGAKVYATQGKIIWHHSNDAPARKDWGNAKALEFYSQVED
jgi:beta-lactamase superfamily II metal-dependent hydrolase